MSYPTAPAPRKSALDRFFAVSGPSGVLAKRSYWALALGIVLLLAASAARADDARVFIEGHSGKGELRYLNDLPVLTVAGTPEEIGQQKAALTTDAIKRIADYPRMLLQRANRADRLPKYIRDEQGDRRESAQRLYRGDEGICGSVGNGPRHRHIGQHAGRRISRRRAVFGADRRAGEKCDRRPAVRT